VERWTSDIERWLVWVHHINGVLPKMGQSPIANSIARSLQIELLGEELEILEKCAGAAIGELAGDLLEYLVRLKFW
jgi:hypothetical protein